MIKNQAEAIKLFLMENIEKHPSDIVAVAMNYFSVTRTTILRHLNYLIKKNKVTKRGVTSSVNYFLLDGFTKYIELLIPKEHDETAIWVRNFETIIESYANKNALDICHYGFTEMLNNVIDHSRGRRVELSCYLEESVIVLIIKDDGLGAFRTLAEAYHMNNFQEVILELSKGKFTSDKKNHSGEGIFFSSKAFDYFELEANGFIYIVDNTVEDWSLCSTPVKKGTSVTMKIHFNINRGLIDVFKQYQDAESFEFDRTRIYVELAKLGEETLISRSQAKRILRNIAGKFLRVTLDFKNIRIIGQGFVDEIFRVFQNNHSEIKIDYCNANSDVEFMLKRGLANRDNN